MNQKPRARAKRPGLTVVDLLFTVAITLVLSGLSLPSLLEIRARSQQEECQSRLTDIGRAFSEFHDANKRLPPAALMEELPVMSSRDFNETLNKLQWTSATTLCWPFMELNNLAELLPAIAFDLDNTLESDPDRDEPFRGPENMDGVDVVLATEIPQLTCPTDEINEITYSHPGIAGVDITNSAYVPRWDGSTINDVDWAGNLFYFPDGTRVMRTNYVSCIGSHGHLLTPDRLKWKGCMSMRKAVTWDDIKDGTGRTIMMAENIGSVFDGERGLDLDDDDTTRTEIGMAWSHLWGGTCQGRGNIPYLTKQLDRKIAGHEELDPKSIPMLGDSQFASVRGFGSVHRSGVNVLMADLSVRTLDRDIDWQVLYQLCGMADGGKPSEEEF